MSECSYDNQGNMIAGGEAEYSYDVFNRMEKAKTCYRTLPKNVDPNNAKNAQDLKDFIAEMNNTTGSTADDIAAFKSLAEEFGLSPNELVGRTIVEDGFMSTSADSTVATGTFTGNMQITAAENRNGVLYISVRIQ